MSSVPRSSKVTTTALTCPDCGFVAKHPMGLGRHRTSQHGVPSQREQRQAASRPSKEADIRDDLLRIEAKLDRVLADINASQANGQPRRRLWRGRK